ncbi:unnamed protein product [Dovyalis caffra]|uniref:Pectinesterase inhibitor domain-containing protein n=1 Tax=Dovyalis caffra TaxID=77055 RepID=A0AAV1RNE2_9ROSI|nr:unnamed protein product [Dovyalis caffra]
MDSKIFMRSNAIALLLTFLLSISTMQTSSADTTTTKNSSETYTNYLKTACNSTLYPQLCFESLSPYTSTIKTNDLKLCTKALTVTLKAASNTSKLVESLSKESNLSKTKAGIIKDCIEETGDSIDKLKQSLKALGSLNGSADIHFQISNIQTWMSAAITEENTCTDGFDERKISDEVMRTIRKTGGINIIYGGSGTNGEEMHRMAGAIVHVQMSLTSVYGPIKDVAQGLSSKNSKRSEHLARPSSYQGPIYHSLFPLYL